ncbi:MAG: hypothetical protein V1660_03245 [archaeon]
MDGECQNRDENKNNCPCIETDCERYGVCCLCVRYHKSKKSLPACLK